MNKFNIILKLLVSKEYSVVIIKRDEYTLIQHIYSSIKRTETTYKKVIRLLKEELKEIRRHKYEQRRLR